MPPQSPNQAQARNRRSLLLLAAAIIVLVTLAVVGIHLWQTYVIDKKVTLAAASGTNITLGKIRGTNNNSVTMGAILAHTSTNKQVRLAPGSYAVTFGGADYQDQTEAIAVSSTMTIATPNLSYSTAKLQDLLAQQAADIHPVVTGIASLSGYTIAYEKLYVRGEWYAAKLTPVDTSTQDTLRVILHKENGRWQVAASPGIVFYSGDYPSIPVSVIRDIDNSQ